MIKLSNDQEWHAGDRQGWVSVVVPTYNRQDLVVGALESILTQNFRPIQVVVVDDGSNDQTADVVGKWARENESEGQFEVLFIQQANRGANFARNTGICKCSGEFVSFLDSDDRWLPAKLGKPDECFQKTASSGGCLLRTSIC